MNATNSTTSTTSTPTRAQGPGAGGSIVAPERAPAPRSYFFVRGQVGPKSIHTRISVYRAGSSSKSTLSRRSISFRH
jgi:hypothetical protein